jgi:hypothetical protein
LLDEPGETLRQGFFAYSEFRSQALSERSEHRVAVDICPRNFK